MSLKPLRILVAEDSPIFALLLTDLVQSQWDMECVGCVGDGQAAVEACKTLRPELVLMDVQMPKLDGLAATSEIMASVPTPILIVTADPFYRGVNQLFRALELGALDLVSKDELRLENRGRLLQKIRLLAGTPVVRHMHRSAPILPPTAAAAVPVGPLPHLGGKQNVVAIAASTGGPRALATVLGGLPAGFDAAILIVQHITQGFGAHLAEWLNQHCPLSVGVGRGGQAVAAGGVYLAPDGCHMELDARGQLRLHTRPAVRGHRPSADVLLTSLCQYNPARTLGVMLSGMGSDGAAGFGALSEAGATIWVQDAPSAVVYGMPQATLSRVPGAHVVDLGEMAKGLATAFGGGT